MIADASSGTLRTVSIDAGHVFDWSPDGRFVLYIVNEDESTEKVVALPVAPGAASITVVSDPVISHAQVSPDGRWLAYSSRKSGRNEVYVTAFPAGGGRWQVSSGGGNKSESDGLFEAGTPQPLFEIDVNPLVNRRSQYAVSGDGQRFLVNALTSELGTQSPTTVVLNWATIVKK